MSDENYANATASLARSTAGVQIGSLPTPAEAAANLDQAMDDSVELDLQRRGTLTQATVVALPTPDPADRFTLRMPLDVQPRSMSTRMTTSASPSSGTAGWRTADHGRPRERGRP